MVLRAGSANKRKIDLPFCRLWIAGDRCSPCAALRAAHMLTAAGPQTYIPARGKPLAAGSVMTTPIADSDVLFGRRHPERLLSERAASRPPWRRRRTYHQPPREALPPGGADAGLAPRRPPLVCVVPSRPTPVRDGHAPLWAANSVAGSLRARHARRAIPQWLANSARCARLA